MPKPTNKKPKARVMHLRKSMRSDTPDALYPFGWGGNECYACIPCPSAKRARSLARFFNLSEEERVEKLAEAIRKTDGGWLKYKADARACLKAMEGA